VDNRRMSNIRRGLNEEGGSELQKSITMLMMHDERFGQKLKWRGMF